jgi:hypothetical protein
MLAFWHKYNALTNHGGKVCLILDFAAYEEFGLNFTLGILPSVPLTLMETWIPYRINVPFETGISLRADYRGFVEKEKYISFSLHRKSYIDWQSKEMDRVNLQSILLDEEVPKFLNTLVNFPAKFHTRLADCFDYALREYHREIKVYLNQITKAI